MKRNQKNKSALGLFLLFIMLNSLAVWAFSFITFSQMTVVYVVNVLPVLALLLILYLFKEKGKSGFIFLIFVFVKLVYLLVFLFCYDKEFGLTRAFVINFLAVYLMLLYLSMFAATRFLSKK